MEKTEKKKSTSFKAHRGANIVVIVIASLAALVLIAIAVLSLVKVDPVDKIETPDSYYFYKSGSSQPLAADESTPSEIRAALGNMKFTVMSGILQGSWDYSYNFKRDADDAKVEISARDIEELTAGDDEYMVEFVYAPIKYDPAKGDLDYSNAQSLEVDGETVYFDRIKMIVGDSEGAIGTISFYPYIYARVNNDTDNDNLSSETYKVTGINVRANTTTAYQALKDLAEKLK